MFHACKRLGDTMFLQTDLNTERVGFIFGENVDDLVQRLGDNPQIDVSRRGLQQEIDDRLETLTGFRFRGLLGDDFVDVKEADVSGDVDDVHPDSDVGACRTGQQHFFDVCGT